MQRNDLTSTVLVNPTQTDTAALDVLVLEMAELILDRHHKVPKADRTTFLQARLPHFKRKNENYQLLAKSMGKATQPSAGELAALNRIAQALALDIEKHTHDHWTLTLLHRHYLKSIRLDQKAIQACQNLALDNDAINTALTSQNTYLQSLNGLLDQVVDTLTQLSQFSAQEDQFAKSPEILTGLLEKSLISDEANAGNHIKRFIFRALAPELVNLDNITLSDKQATALDALVNLVITISKQESAAESARLALSKKQIGALAELGVNLRAPMHYISNGVLEPMRQAASSITHTSRASQAAYRAINRRRNMFDLMSNLTTVLDETTQLHGNLTSAQLLQDTPEEAPKGGVLTYFTQTMGQVGNILYAGANAAADLGTRVVSANPWLATKPATPTLADGIDDERLILMAAFQEITDTLNLPDQDRAACLNAFLANVKKNQREDTTNIITFDLDSVRAQINNIKSKPVQLALMIRKLKMLIIANADETLTDEVAQEITRINAEIIKITDENHQTILRGHLDDLLFTLHEYTLLPVLYEALDNSTNSRIPTIALQRVIKQLESRHSLPSRDDWKALKKHEQISGISLFKHRKILPEIHGNERASAPLDMLAVKTPAQQTQAQLQTIIDTALPTLFNAMIASIQSDKESAQRLRRLLKTKDKSNLHYLDKLQSKVALCDELLLALDSMQRTDRTQLAATLSRTIHGYTIQEANKNLQKSISSPFNLVKQLLKTANHVSEASGVLASNNPLLSKCLTLIFDQLDLSEASLALDNFHKSPININDEDALWFNDALQDPLSTTSLSSAVVVNTLTESTSGIVSLLRTSAAETPGVIIANLMKLIPDLFPGMKMVSFILRQALKSTHVTRQLENMITAKSDPEVIARWLVSFFITSYDTAASTNTPARHTSDVLLNNESSNVAQANFTEFFFKFHRLCLLTKTEPGDMLKKLDGANELSTEAKKRCVQLHQKLYGAIQGKSMREALQSMLNSPDYGNVACILLLHRAKQQLNLALKLAAEGRSYSEIQGLIEDAYLSFEFLQSRQANLSEAHQALVTSSLDTLNQKIAAETAALATDAAALNEDSTLKRQKAQIERSSLKGEAALAQGNTPNLLFRIGKFAYTAFSATSFWYSSVIAPLFLSTTNASGYLSRIVGFAAAGSGPITTAFGYASFGILIASVVGRFAYEIYKNRDNFKRVWNNANDSIPNKILKSAGYVGLALVNAVFKTVLTTFAVEKISSLASTVWTKVKAALYRKDMLREIDKLTTLMNNLRIEWTQSPIDNEYRFGILKSQIATIKDNLATSPHQTDALQPLKLKLEQLDRRFETLKASLGKLSSESATQIFKTLQAKPAAARPNQARAAEPSISLAELAAAKQQGKIHTYSEEPVAPPTEERPLLLRPTRGNG